MPTRPPLDKKIDYADIREIGDPGRSLPCAAEKLTRSLHTWPRSGAAIAAVVADRGVGIVITGEGRAFSAGLDSQALVDVTAAEASAPGSRSTVPGPEIPGLFTYLLAVPKPVIAAVNGVAAGGGLVLAAKCDVRIASAAASFTTVFLKRGLIGEHGMTWILPRLVGPSRAMDLLMTSKRIDAAEAHRIGLVDYVCEEGEDVVARAKAYVREVAANAAPMAFAETKSLMYAHMGADYERAFREADAVQWKAVGRPDATEGARAWWRTCAELRAAGPHPRSRCPLTGAADGGVGCSSGFDTGHRHSFRTHPPWNGEPAAAAVAPGYPQMGGVECRSRLCGRAVNGGLPTCRVGDPRSAIHGGPLLRSGMRRRWCTRGAHSASIAGPCGARPWCPRANGWPDHPRGSKSGHADIVRHIRLGR